MATKIAFEIEINGVKTAIKNQEDLKTAVKTVSDAFKKADFGTEEYAELEKTLFSLQKQQSSLANNAKIKAKEQEQAAKELAATQAKAAKEQSAAAAKAAKDAEVSAEIASGSYKGLRLELSRLKAEYDTLSESERGAAGRPLLDRIAKVKSELSEYNQDVKDTARQQEIASTKAVGSYRAINAELVSLRRQYKELSREERDVAGPALLGRIGKLDKELKDLDSDMGQYQRNVGNYSDALSGIGSSLLDLGGIDLSALATPAGAFAAAGAAAIAAASYVKEMSAEVRALRGEIQTFTGASGAELDEFTARVQGISETFGASTNEINNAANSAAKQLGISFDDALTQLENGFIAGLDANGELLDSTREYATFFADAFGPGEKAANALFETIKRGNEQGIFNDKAVDAVKEVTLRLRELPKATRGALDAIGLSSDDIAAQIQDEGIGAAIATVSTRLGELERDSPEVGQAIADIFGGPGEDAGFDFLVSLQDINDATGTAIDTTNEYQVQQQKALKVNQEFARAQVEVAAAFGDSGASLDNLLVQGQTLLLRFLVPIIDNIRSFFTVLSPLVDAIVNLGRAFGILGPEVDSVGAFTKVAEVAAQAALLPFRLLVAVVTSMINAYTGVVNKGKEFLTFLGVLGDEQESTGQKSDFAAEQFGKLADQTKRTGEEADKTKKKTEDAAKAVKKLGDETKKTAVATEQFAKGSLSFLQKQLGDLRKDLERSVPGGEDGILSKIINVEQAIKDINEGRTRLKAQIADVASGIEQVQLIQPVDEAISQVQRTNEGVLSEQDKFSEKLNAKREENTRLQQERVARELAAEELKAARIAEISGAVFSSFNGINDALAQSSQSRADEELRAVQQRYAGEIEAAEGNEELQQELREEQAAAELSIQQQELERQKKFRIASARASQAEGIVNILTAPTTIPDPFGSIFKGLRIAALSVQTQLQIGNIRRQQVAAKGAIVGGWVRGESHRGPNGGTSLSLNGQPVLAEAGEFVDYDEWGAAMVVNKRSAAAHASTLNRAQGVSFPGKRALFSQINTDKGHGIPFMQSGGILEPSMAGLAAINQSGGGGGGGSTGAVQISPDSIAMIAAATGNAVMVGSREGTAAGASDANRRNEREERLRTKTG